jgi:hypothetical protein
MTIITLIEEEFRKKVVTPQGFNIYLPADRETSECKSVWMKISLQAADKVNRWNEQSE